MKPVIHLTESRHRGVMKLLLHDFDDRVPVIGWIIVMHLIQRLVECLFVSKSRNSMSPLHYLLGIVFYVLLPLTTLVSLPGKEASIVSVTTLLMTIPVIGSAISQNISIRAMARLRDPPNDQHHSCPPRRGLFKYIMSPQMLFEILFYFFLIPLAGFHMMFPFIFTLVNQGISAKLTLNFYMEKFGQDSVAGRKALVPFIF